MESKWIEMKWIENKIKKKKTDQEEEKEKRNETIQTNDLYIIPVCLCSKQHSGYAYNDYSSFILMSFASFAAPFSFGWVIIGGKGSEPNITYIFYKLHM